MRAFLRLVFVACFALLTAGPHVLAQSDGSSVYSTARPGSNARGPLDWLFGRRAAPPAAAPRADSRPRSYQPRKRTATAPRPQTSPVGPQIGPQLPVDPNAPAAPDTSQPQVADGTPQPAVPAQPAGPAISVAVVGDSLSVFLAQGLQDVYGERPGINFIKRNREASGLVREDYFDWPKGLRELLSGTDKIDAVVVMIGSNDRQQLRDESGVHEPLTERWRELYARRIDALAAIAREKSVPLIWVGLPIMRSAKYSTDLLAFNDIYRARAQAAGVAYVDVWEAFTGDDGAYVVSGPDVGGEIVRLRTADGVHFTRAGARKLAFFADKALSRIVADLQARATPASAPVSPVPQVSAPVLPGPLVMLPAQPDVKLPNALQSIDAVLGIPMPDRPLPSLLTPRPAQGPVMPLTVPVRTAGAELAVAAQSQPRTASEAAQVFLYGQSPQAKPGRADDFRVNSD